METPQTPESREVEQNAVEQLLGEIQLQVEVAYSEIPEAPETCELDGRTWSCEGDARMELIAQQTQKVEAVRGLMESVREQNQAAEQGSEEQRATFKALQWLQAEYDIQSSELQATRARFTQEALRQKAANDNRAPEAVAA